MKLKSVMPLEGYKLDLIFENNIYGQIDLSSFLQTGIFTKLLDYKYFQKAKPNKNGTAIFRDEDLDIDAYACYQEIVNK